MLTFADSSFLISLYISQPLSGSAERLMREQMEELAFTPLHRIEVRNGIRRAVHRGEIDRSDRHLAFARIDHDLAEGILEHVGIDWAKLLRETEELGEKHAEATGCRSLDLMHVAVALINIAEKFLSFDRRQRELARRAGLRVLPVKL